MVLCSLSSNTECLVNEDIWTCDSGCMNNLTGYQTNMTNMTNMRKAIEDYIVSASGSMSVASIGNLKCYPLNGNPSCPFNLFSVTKATNLGWRLTELRGIRI